MAITSSFSHRAFRNREAGIYAHPALRPPPPFSHRAFRNREAGFDCVHCFPFFCSFSHRAFRNREAGVREFDSRRVQQSFSHRAFRNREAVRSSGSSYPILFTFSHRAFRNREAEQNFTDLLASDMLSVIALSGIVRRSMPNLSRPCNRVFQSSRFQES